MSQLIECVPNFSEGVNLDIIKQITDAIEQVESVKLLNVDPGKATNRTVVTFVGEPNAVIEAAFRAIKMASEIIDMSKHKGEHPRMGATDVCPLIPISGISMEETTEYARKLAKRVGDELQIPIYLYENAALIKGRTNLSEIRSGEYEGFFEKIKKNEWKPDFGPAEMNVKAGASVIGARDFLVAYNVNLNTTSVRKANSIAFDVRERGRVKRDGNPITGKILKDTNGDPIYEPGTLKSVKAIGWFIDEYGVAQISMNLTNINDTPLHIAFDEVCDKAQKRGIRVTGSELVGLVPLKTMLDAGRYFLKKQQRSVGVSDDELIKIAIKTMGLDELSPFEPQKRIIEYLLVNEKDEWLVNMSLKAFANETASESPAPGGGSIAAYAGALSASLTAMVANLSANKRGWDERWEEFSDIAEKAQNIKNELVRLVDEDTKAFNGIMQAFELPKSNESEINFRKEAIADATRFAIETPLKTMKKAFDVYPYIQLMIEKGNPNSITDVGVAALCAHAAVAGAYMNVMVNLKDFEEGNFKSQIQKQAKDLLESSFELSQKLSKTVYLAIQ